MPDVSAPVPSGVRPILDLLACPWCRSPVAEGAGGLRCTRCPALVPAREGILDLARRGTAETWGSAESEASSQHYQAQYTDPGLADAYNRDYAVRPLKRMSTMRERRLIGRLLGSQGKVGTLLELPCGGGRLSPSFAPWTGLLIQADTGWGQLVHASRSAPLPVPRVVMAASGFHIPVRDASLDGVACVRLNHHLPTAEERRRLLEELLRVAKRYVLMTFFDHRSVKNRLRMFRGQPSKLTMTTEEVAGIAREHGAEVVAAPMISWLNSGHRYALMVRGS